MIICFECSRESKRLLDSLLETKSFDDYSQVIESALQTLHLLKQEMGGEKSIVIGEAHGLSQTVIESVLEEAAGPSLFQGSAEKTVRRSLASSVPELFQHAGLSRPSAFAELAGDSHASAEEVPLDRWLFAMYNKLMPAKANCRALAHLQAELGRSVHLSVVHERIGEQVARLGDYLKRLDSRYKLKRDDALSVAFPLSGDKGDKSVSRYIHQFIGNVNKLGEVSGMLSALKLVGYSRDRDPEISLSEAGWQLAILQNPVLDTNVDQQMQIFGSEEVEFLLGHIRAQVPVERFTYITLLKLIRDGKNSPDNLDASLKVMLSSGGRKYTNSFLSSQRSGAISRMADLRLVGRLRHGVKVTYVVTDLGKDFLKSMENKNEQG